MKKIIIIVFLPLTALLCWTCKKSSSPNPSSGGTVIQGNVTVTIDVKHHQWGVPSIPVYLKFNTTEWPGRDSSKYDVKGTADHEGSIVFNHLGTGDFVIYTAGYDSIWGGYVIGYTNLSITKADANTTVYTTVIASEKF